MGAVEAKMAQADAGAGELAAKELPVVGEVLSEENKSLTPPAEVEEAQPEEVESNKSEVKLIQVEGGKDGGEEAAGGEAAEETVVVEEEVTPVEEEAPEEEEAEETKKAITITIDDIRTAPPDYRFPTTNQTKHCYTRYNEYHKCQKEKGEGAPECNKYKQYYYSLCPLEWIEKWDEERERGVFPGPY